jgi:hypothetical protein
MDVKFVISEERTTVGPAQYEAPAVSGPNLRPCQLPSPFRYAASYPWSPRQTRQLPSRVAGADDGDTCPGLLPCLLHHHPPPRSRRRTRGSLGSAMSFADLEAGALRAPPDRQEGEGSRRRPRPRLPDHHFGRLLPPPPQLARHAQGHHHPP